MDVETVKALMVEQLDAARAGPMKDEYGWSFEEKDLIVYVTMRARTHRETTYVMRVSFDEFLRRAPSYVFVDATSREMTAEAWPRNVKHDHAAHGICTPGTREFHETYHLNDAAYPWSAERYSFRDTVQRIQKMIDVGAQ